MMNLTENQTLQTLHQFIYTRYQRNANKTFQQLIALDQDFLVLDSPLLVFLVKSRLTVLQILRQELTSTQNLVLLPLFLKMTQKTIYQHNQFLMLSSLDQHQLVQIYRQFMVELQAILEQEHNLEELKQLLLTWLKSHFVNLRAFALALHQTFELLDKEVVCREYRAELQLQVLGIDPLTLEEPIFDIGCGEQGQLVKYLRNFGLEAFGVDRLVTPSKYLLKANWLELRLRTEQWGTIISHLAFSNHFIFHHSYHKGEPEKYARKFMEVLASLKAGGSFYYAPGLLFIEPLLPTSRYTITKQLINLSELDLGRGNLAGDKKQSLNPDLLYSTHIIKGTGLLQ